MEERQQWTDYRGQRRQNMDGFWYTVGERTGRYHYSKPLMRITFDSGYFTEVTAQDIWRNRLKDWGSPSVMGVGIVGWHVPKPTKHPLYGVWHGMLERCLGPRRKANRSYDGVTIGSGWIRFDTFVEDAPRLPGYDLARIASGELQLDKDKLGTAIGRREYSLETCCWLTRQEQAAYRSKPAVYEGNRSPKMGVPDTFSSFGPKPTGSPLSTRSAIFRTSSSGSPFAVSVNVKGCLAFSV
jgi:hypothetical protein